jgi:hypothetical protein
MDASFGQRTSAQRPRRDGGPRPSPDRAMRMVLESAEQEEIGMTKVAKAQIANPLRAIRHADGFHARAVANKKAYRRNDKHRGDRSDH